MPPRKPLISDWLRDHISARRIFRKSLHTGSWKRKGLRYRLPALPPERSYVSLIARADRQDASG